MRGWKKICCPIDFSTACRKALVHAAELAREANGHLTVLHVHQGASPKLQRVLGVGSHDAYEEDLAEVTAALEREVAKAEAILPGRVSAQLVRGDAAESILHYARKHHPDALVLARHGGAARSKRRTLGSVAEQVVRSAPCTVVVVRPDALFAIR